MAKSEASVSTWKGLVGSGWTNTRVVRKAALRASKARCAVEVQKNGVSFLGRMKLEVVVKMKNHSQIVDRNLENR